MREFKMDEELELGIGHLSNILSKELEESKDSYTADRVLKVFSKLVVLYGSDDSKYDKPYVKLIETEFKKVYENYRGLLDKYGIKYKIKENDENNEYVIILVKNENTRYV